MKNFINSYDRVKIAIESNQVRNVFDIIDGIYTSRNGFEYSEEAEIILELVAKNGEGFVVDICNRVLDSIKRYDGRPIVMTDKQRWCIAFAAIKMTSAMLDQLREKEEEPLANDANPVENCKEADSAKHSIENSISVEDIRMINEYQESGRVFIHLKNGRNICRTMLSSEIQNAQRIRSHEGYEAFRSEIVRLFNDKYSKPQQTRNKCMTYEDERFWELHNMRKICVLPPVEEAEYERLLNKSDFINAKRLPILYY